MVIGPAPAPRLQPVPYVEWKMVDARHANAEGPQWPPVKRHLVHGRHHALPPFGQGPQQARRRRCGRNGYAYIAADKSALAYRAIEVTFGHQECIGIEHGLARYNYRQQLAKVARGRQLHARSDAAIENRCLEARIQLAEQWLG